MRIVDVLLKPRHSEAAVFYSGKKKLTFRKKCGFLETFSSAKPYYFITEHLSRKGLSDERSENVICS
ncbi:hypothetical protein CWD84_11475 [Bacillus siamensis]|uniref:Uncharacterized protein n=1 Tax=Bacillus siamensis TaxID=659243 RepID=A0AAI8N295_9BACI|nr:hypothetical protein CWD84_11475 [Bacillus siamensis]